MALFIQGKRSLKLNGSDLDLDEKVLIEKLWALLEKYGYDLDSACTGVFPSPDFGYFDLAGRYWRASLCIYFAGFCKGFIEAGAGFLEPWLFNCRHAVELYLKGFQMYVIWYQEIHNDFLRSGYKTQVEKIQNVHNLGALYNGYRKALEKVVNSWNAEKICDPPEMEKMILSKCGVDILNEISESDASSFRYRYPSLIHQRGKNGKHHKLQEMSWEWNEEKIFPTTGLPKSPGVAFTHVRVINNIHDLIREFVDISRYHDAIYSYLREMQDIAFDLHHEFYSDML
jgi:hypothetical protein